MARHPSATSQAAPIRLYGQRVVLRPLAPGDFAEWSEVRRRKARARGLSARDLLAELEDG